MKRLQTWLMLESRCSIWLTKKEHNAWKSWPDPGSLGQGRPSAAKWLARLRQACDQRGDQMPHLPHFLHIPEPLLLSSSDAAESVERTQTTFGVCSHQHATIISWSVCAVCSQVFVKRKVIRLFLGVLCSCRGEADQSTAAVICPRSHCPAWKGPSL